MPKILTRLTVSVITCLSTLCSNAALAQDNRWFRVELLVFSHEAPSANISAANAEQWEPTPRLVYPGAARFLVEPKRVKANLEEYRGESMVDEFGRQLVTILPEADTPQPGAAATGKPAPLQPVYEVPATAPTPLGAAEKTADNTISAQPAAPTPFTALPSQHLELRGKAAYMQRRGLYTTLYHQTWLQQVAEQANSLPIVIDRSGDSGQWPRLQGSINLYLSRYLHLETNLWLNTHGDYLPGTWRMPAPPLGPPSLIVEDLSNPDPLPWLAEAGAETPTIPPAPAPVEMPSAVASGAESAPTAEAEDLEELEELVEEGPVYPWRHAVLLQQKRRMRSTEVHYIDHPMLGVVIKITPVSTEELTTFALAEAAE